MLVSYYGKLPHLPEFVQSSELTGVLRQMITWIELGQNHMGKAMLVPQVVSGRIHFMKIDQSILGVAVYGIFVASHDSKSRQCPFLLFHEDCVEVKTVMQAYQVAFDESGFDVSAFERTDNQSLLAAFGAFVKDSPDEWALYCERFLMAQTPIESDVLNGMVYRKLMVGQT